MNIAANKEAVEENNVIKNVINLRSEIYGFLSRGFSMEIDSEYLARIRSFLPVLEEFGKQTSDELYLNGVGKLHEFIRDADDETETIEKNATKYATVFLNVSPNDVVQHVHPYESVYLSAEKLVMQDQRDEVVEFYVKHGLGVHKNFKEPEDHIAAELSFLCSLNEKIVSEFGGEPVSNAVVYGLTEQQRFMKEHLLRWVHLMCHDLKKADPDGFYSALADLVMGFVRVDYGYLQEMIEYFSSGQTEA